MKKGLISLLAIVSIFSVISSVHAASTNVSTSATASKTSEAVISPYASKVVTRYIPYHKSITPPSSINYSDADGYQGTLYRKGISGTSGDNIIWMYQGTVTQN